MRTRQDKKVSRGEFDLNLLIWENVYWPRVDLEQKTHFMKQIWITFIANYALCFNVFFLEWLVL